MRATKLLHSAAAVHSPHLLPLLRGRNSHQVANYPAQLRQTHELRKKAHVDSGALTLLAAEDWLPGSTWRPGDGGLQLLNAAGEWVEVAVPQGACSSCACGAQPAVRVC